MNNKMTFSLYRLAFSAMLLVSPLHLVAVETEQVGLKEAKQMARNFSEQMAVFAEALRQHPDDAKLAGSIVDYTQALLNYEQQVGKSLGWIDPEVWQLQREALSAQLGGVDIAVLTAHPDFEEFAITSDLAHHMNQEGHYLVKNPFGEPLLLVNDEFLAWSEFKAQVLPHLDQYTYDESGFVAKTTEQGLQPRERFTLSAAQQNMVKALEELPIADLDAVDEDVWIDEQMAGLSAPAIIAPPRHPREQPTVVRTSTLPRPVDNQLFAALIPAKPEPLAKDLVDQSKKIKEVAKPVLEWTDAEVLFFAFGVQGNKLIANQVGDLIMVKIPEVKDKRDPLSNQYLVDLLMALVEQRDGSFPSGIDRVVYKAADKLSQQMKEKAVTEQLNALETAVRLGISYEAIEKNPDFAQFARANLLGKYVELYGPDHKPRWDAAKGELSLMMNGEHQDWEIVKTALKDDSTRKMQKHVYTYQGVVEDVDIPVFKHIDLPKSTQEPEKAYVQVVHYGPRPVAETASYWDQAWSYISFADEHVWLRVIDTRGDVRSIGFNPQDPLKSVWSKMYATTGASPGKIFTPDSMETMLDGVQTVATFEVDPAMIETILAAVRQEKLLPRQYHIAALQAENCVTFLARMLKIVGITPANSSYPFGVKAWQLETQEAAVGG